MNAKVEKKIRREVGKAAKVDAQRFSKMFVDEIAAMNLLERLRFCRQIFRIPRRKANG